MIRQLADRAANDALPRQLQRVSELAIARNPSVLKDEPLQYVAARLIPLVFDKVILETEADLEAYLAALRNAYSAELQRGKRITL